MTPTTTPKYRTCRLCGCRSLNLPGVREAHWEGCPLLNPRTGQIRGPLLPLRERP